MDNKVVLTLQNRIFMSFESLRKFTHYDSEFTKKLYIASYRRSFELRAETFKENASFYKELEDVMLCYQHLTKNMDVLNA